MQQGTHRINHIIVQAGGKGTRMGKHTANKPKALVSVAGKPLLFHLFDAYPDAHFIIIGDYKFEVLKEYCDTFAEVDISWVRTKEEGTCAGIGEALKNVPSSQPFALVWSDLYFKKGVELPETSSIFLAGSFPCRWKFQRGKLEEESSMSYGVAGLFTFSSPSEIMGVPRSGEFVRWLSKQKHLSFQPVYDESIQEIGSADELEKARERMVCRPFNHIVADDRFVVKIPLTVQGAELAAHEARWYKTLRDSYHNIPEVYGYAPIALERIVGAHPWEAQTDEMRVVIIDAIVKALKDLHGIATVHPLRDEMLNNYLWKTIERVAKVKHLIPGADCDFIMINGRACKNVMADDGVLWKLVNQLPMNDFVIIHGDPTFSNTLLDHKVRFIDPRGYFGGTEMFGDPNLDWAKVYYSLATNYDQFNQRNFVLNIKENGIEIRVDSNGYEALADHFLETSGADKRTMQTIAGLLWLSLTSYAWDDYDSICGAYYMGTLLLQEVV